MLGRARWPLAWAVTRPEPPTRVAARRHWSPAQRPLERVVKWPQWATQLQAGLLKPPRSRFRFHRWSCGLGDFPDDLKPPIVTGLNAVVDRRRSAFADGHVRQAGGDSRLKMRRHGV